MNATLSPSALEREYRSRLAQRLAALAAKERTHAGFAYARLGVLASAIGIIAIGGLGATNWLLVPLAAFSVLAFGHARLLNARDRAKSAVGFYERGLERITHQWIGRGRDGRHLAPAAHLYAEDLDVFGRGSLFELLATTRTHAGEETLARWLLEPAPPAVVRARQEAVRELSARLDLRERVAVMGDQLGLGVHAGLLRRWSQSLVTLAGTGARLGVAALVVSMLSTLAWWLSTSEHGAMLLALVVAQMSVAAFFKARVISVIEAVDEPAHDLDLLADLLRAIETEPFTSARLRELQAAVRGSGRQASAEIGRLSQLTAMLSSRQNVLFVIPASMVMWATQWAFAIEAWRKRAGMHVPAWLDVVGEFEALLALGTFSAEHPDYVFPEFVDAGALIAAQAVAHPTLPPAAVANAIALGADAPRLIIVSGSNMSGKSTFLRAIGANVVLAQTGAPVRAAAFRLSPLAVGAAIRVQDSLTDGRSRFLAEITRVKEIVDMAAARRGAVLFLLDEILGGTNSHDRRIGSEAVLAGLTRAGAIGLVTTHDLALGEIAERLPGVAENVALRGSVRERPTAVRLPVAPGHRPHEQRHRADAVDWAGGVAKGRGQRAEGKGNLETEGQRDPTLFPVPLKFPLPSALCPLPFPGVCSFCTIQGCPVGSFCNHRPGCDAKRACFCRCRTGTPAAPFVSMSDKPRQDLKARAFALAERVFKLYSQLATDGPAYEHVARQLLRAATGIGALLEEGEDRREMVTAACADHSGNERIRGHADSFGAQVEESTAT